MTDVHRLSRLALLSLLGATAACQAPESRAGSTFYERKIGPILQQTCANSPTQSGCHVAADDRGNALGNLDVTSFEAVKRRRDLLVPYGPYLMPALLVKALRPFQMRLTTWDSAEPIILTSDVPHGGGPLLDITSTSFNSLSAWIERGATENNAIAAPPVSERTPCSPTPGSDPAFDPAADPTAADFATFTRRVNPVIADKCSAGNCHGSAGNSLYLTCGKTEEQKRWNYFAVSDYVSVDPPSSEILRRTLDPSAGGTYHEGGALFATQSDPGFRAMLDWAKEKGGPTTRADDPTFTFFAHRVQPMLVKRGCMLLGCHSPAMGHEYRLRAGSGGHFGLPATRRNYALTREQIAPESPDPNASRLLRKNLPPYLPGSPAPTVPLGVVHRGGALFGSGGPCTDPAAAETGDLDAQDPYCVVRRWVELEREKWLAERAPEPLSAVVYVTRPLGAGKDAAQDFEVYSPGADLIRAPATQDSSGALSVQGGQSLLAACGLTPGIDVRRPAVSWDGKRIAFSARASATEPYRVYVWEDSGCALEPSIAADPVDDAGRAVPANGELVHDFDPTFAPDGRIVFASTRGNVTNTSVFDYQGPQRTPADPSRLNANLYVSEPHDGGTRIRQLTFLPNQELTPSFMADGRLIMVTEKRTPGFYQLAARRQNLDGGDYHPLFGQRATIGFHQITDVVELADKNFAAIFSDRGAAHGAGALGVMNRSLGVDQTSQDAADYLQDPKAMSWQNPKFFQRSVRLLDGNGRVGASGGVYRNPSRLPDGRILVSYAPDVADLASFDARFEAVVVDPLSGARSAPVVTAADSVLWPTAVYARFDHGVFESRLDEPNGATRVSEAEGERERSDVTFLDVPLLSSLVFQNTRSRRLIADPAGDLELWEELPPEPGVTSYEQGGSFVTDDEFGRVYVRRRRLGAVNPLADGSARVVVPGGVPIVLAPLARLAGEKAPARHHQREQVQFYPGETVNQGFQRSLFDGVCGSCHGAVSGYEHDIAANPDILTKASQVLARDERPVELLRLAGPPAGPPFP